MSREEDWSDWLAHLIERSEHGFLAVELGRDASARAAGVEREVSTVEGYRADLLVHWRDGSTSHLEVKVGDTAFAKTFKTSEALRRRSPDRIWSDHILLPDEHVGDWWRVADTATGSRVGALCWTDVVIRIRCALLERRETLAWRVWASTFCGAIEQTLLRLPRVRRGEAPRSPDFLLAHRHADILRKAER